MTSRQNHPAVVAALDDDESSSPSDALHLILHHLLPLLLAAATSARLLITRWRLLHSKLSLLRSSLSDAAAAPAAQSNSLFLHLIPSLLPALSSLTSLAARCQDPDLPDGKLRLQSDLDVAGSILDIHLHDLSVLIRSGLLHRRRDDADAAALVLPLPGRSASRSDLVLFVGDLFARLQIGGLDLKGKALDSLIDLLDSQNPSKIARLVAEEGDLPLLIRYMDSSAAHSLLRERAAAAVSVLATSSDASRRAVFENGALGPLLRLLDVGPAPAKERAAAAVQAITADSASAWAVAAYGGVPILVAACRSGISSIQALASGSLKNIVAIDDTRATMVEDGAVPAFLDLLLSGNLDAQKNASLCLASLATLDGDEVRTAILREGGLQRLLQLLRETSESDTIDYALRAIHALSISPLAARSLSSSPTFFLQLADLIRRGCGGNASIQQTAASLISILSPSEDTKRSMAGSMAALIKMMEFSKPASAQEAAGRALAALLSTKFNRKELSRDGKSITRLVRLLDPENDVDKKSVVAVVLALTSGSGGARKRLGEAGAYEHLQKLAEAEVAGAKKAMQRIATGRIKTIFSLGGWTQWSQ